MSGLDVDPPALAAAGHALTDQGEALSAAVGVLSSSLSGSGQTCGNDRAGQVFALNYQRGGEALLAAAAAAANACGNLGYGIGVSASNYARSESASHISGAPPSVHPPAQPAKISSPSMPSPQGGSVGEPTLWSLVERFVGSPWPDGSPDSLHTAAGAWRTMASTVSSTVGPVNATSTTIGAQKIPEASAIVTHVTQLSSALSQLARQCTAMGSELDAFASSVSASQEAIRDLLHRLSISGVIEQLGSIFTGHNPWDDVKQIGHDISAILNTLRSEADAAETMFQTTMSALDSATNSFEAWADKEFTHFFGEDVGGAMSDAFTGQVDLSVGVLSSALHTVDGVQQLATNPRQWEAMAKMVDPAYQMTELAKDPEAYVKRQGEVLKQLVHTDELTGDHPMRGVGRLAGDVAQVFIPGAGAVKAAGEVKAVGEGAQAARLDATAVRTESSAAGKSMAGALPRNEIVVQGAKITDQLAPIGNAEVPVTASAAAAAAPRSITRSEVDSMLAEAPTYRSTITVTAERAEHAMDWKNGSGDTMHAEAGDWILRDSATAGDPWTVKPDLFDQTYAAIDGNQYQKTAGIVAVQVPEPFAVTTLEGTATGAAGDWLVRNPTGEYWPITDDVFRGRYEPLVDHPTADIPSQAQVDTGPAGLESATDHPVPPDPPAADPTPPPAGVDVDSGVLGWEHPDPNKPLTLDPIQNQAAEGVLEKARFAEPAITQSMKDIEAKLDTGHLVGEEYKLKSEESVKEKISTAIFNAPEVPLSQHISGINDVVRYTFQPSVENYAVEVQQAVRQLENSGYECSAFKNYWASDGYQGINSTWIDPRSGQSFEVQFHTTDSFDAKQRTHPFYEEERLPETSIARIRELKIIQEQIFAAVPTPIGAVDLQIGRG